MAATAPADTPALLDLIRQSGVLPDATAADTLSAAASLPPDPVHAATALIRKGVLTQFQARMLLAGKIRGFRLGDYLIQDQIGKGGMGAVFLAVHQTLGRKVAIKVLPPVAAGDRVAQERFLREARTAAALDHPNIVKLFDVCKSGDVRYLVLEYVDGQTLEQAIQAGGISPSRAVGYVAQAAAGLQHAHEKGFIHRDIKPANLILTADGTVKILDMGLARAADNTAGLTEQLDQGAVVGTADYVAPEQAMNMPGLDIRADIYSLGVTFYALITGRPPFSGSTASKLVQHQLKDAPSLSRLDKTFPPKLATVAARMMAKRPDDRYPTPADVILALQPWLTESPNLTAGVNQTQAARTHLSTRNLRASAADEPARKRGVPVWVWAAGGGAALAAVIGGIALAVLMRGDTKPTGVVSRPTTPAAPPTDPDTPPTKPDGTGTAPSKPAPPPPAVTWADGQVLYALDLSKQQPFEVDGTSMGMSGKTGAGDFPDGWSVKTWKAEDRAKGFADTTAAGGPALGAKSVAGNAILFSPEIDFKTAQFVKLKFEYQSSASEKQCTVRVREMGAQKTDNENLRPGYKWTKFEKVYDVAAFKNAVRVEFHNSDKGTDLRVRNFRLLATEKR